MPDAMLYTSIKHKITDLLSVANVENTYLGHVKLHGALYNLAALKKNRACGYWCFKILRCINKNLCSLWFCNADFTLHNNIKIVYEAFADRNYNNDLTFVSW